MKKEKRVIAKKGAIHVIEAAIAAMLVFGFIIGILPIVRFEDVTEVSRQKAEDALASTYNTGSLRQLAVANNTATIKTTISENLPESLRFRFTVALCTANLTSGATNCTYADSLPQNITIASSSVAIAGANSSFSPREVITYVW